MLLARCGLIVQLGELVRELARDVHHRRSDDHDDVGLEARHVLVLQLEALERLEHLEQVLAADGLGEALGVLPRGQAPASTRGAA